MFSRYTSSTPFACKLNALLATNVNVPRAKYSSSETSSNGGMLLVIESSSSVTISPLAYNTMTCLFRHWLAMWPLPWHLKHLISRFLEVEASVLPWGTWLVVVDLGSDLGVCDLSNGLAWLDVQEVELELWPTCVPLPLLSCCSTLIAICTISSNST